MYKCVYLVCEMLNDEGLIGHAWLLEQRTRLEVCVVKLLSPGVIRTLWHLQQEGEESTVKEHDCGSR